MFFFRLPFATALFVSVLCVLSACSDHEQSTAPVTSDTPTDITVEPSAESVANSTITAEETEGRTRSSKGSADAGEIDEDSLHKAGQIELSQYTVAYVGSATMGGGTLTVNGKSRPFKIAGLGVGGFGASAIDASGVVYNLPSLDAFPGTYGNARLGLTAGESGGGKLWLRNPNGVVIELVSEMRGLALAGGVDGILIQWDEGEDSAVDRVMEDSEEVVGNTIEAGADVVEDGVGTVKKWFKSN